MHGAEKRVLGLILAAWLLFSSARPEFASFHADDAEGLAAFVAHDDAPFGRPTELDVCSTGKVVGHEAAASDAAALRRLSGSHSVGEGFPGTVAEIGSDDVERGGTQIRMLLIAPEASQRRRADVGMGSLQKLCGKPVEVVQDAELAARTLFYKIFGKSLQLLW